MIPIIKIKEWKIGGYNNIYPVSKMTPWPLIPPKVYPLVAHTKNKDFGVKQNSSKYDCV